MKNFDGYCLKTPHGDLWPAYFSYEKTQVIEDARNNNPDYGGIPSWRKLHREGYRVVKVKITAVREVS